MHDTTPQGNAGAPEATAAAAQAHPYFSTTPPSIMPVLVEQVPSLVNGQWHFTPVGISTPDDVDAFIAAALNGTDQNYALAFEAAQDKDDGGVYGAMMSGHRNALHVTFNVTVRRLLLTMLARDKANDERVRKAYADGHGDAMRTADAAVKAAVASAYSDGTMAGYRAGWLDRGEVAMRPELVN